MATGKRRPLHPNSTSSGSSGSPGGSFRSSRLNFRPTNTQEDRRGTKPTAAPSSVGLILVTMIIHVCKKSLLFDPKLKVGIYCGAIFVVSIIADYVSLPRTYFSRSDNVFNRYFVKWGWGWLLSVTIPWVALTGHILGCGKRVVPIKHLGRLAVATIAWMIWIRVFNFIETNHGRCLGTKDPGLQTKANCLQAGKFWSGFDISGHTFILIYSSLILAEEGAAIVGWEGIRDSIVHEEHSRNTPGETSSGHLRYLSTENMDFLKKTYGAVTPYLRGLFIAMTMQQLLWDVMLVSTMMYYHIMLEKMFGAFAAILTWHATYHWWFGNANGLLMSPGDGLFKYNETREHNAPAATRSRRNTLNGSGPRFMGMPIRTSQPKPEANLSKTTETELPASRT